MSSPERFPLAETDSARFYAEAEGIHVFIYRQGKGADEPGKLVLDVPLDRLRLLLQWADKYHMIAYLSGPLAESVRRSSNELGVSTDTFVTTAVNAFIEAGK